MGTLCPFFHIASRGGVLLLLLLTHRVAVVPLSFSFVSIASSSSRRVVQKQVLSLHRALLRAARGKDEAARDQITSHVRTELERHRGLDPRWGGASSTPA